MSSDPMLALIMVIPLIGTIFIQLLGKRPNAREAATLTTASITFLSVMTLFPRIFAGERPRFQLAEPLPGIPLVLELEPLGLLFAFVASFLWIVTTIYAIGYMRGHHEENQTRFFTFFAVAIFGALGVAFSGNLFTLFVAYEVLTLSTFPLVTHHQTDESKRAGRIYMGILLSTSIILFLPALIWTYSLAGTVDFVPGGILRGNASPTAIGILIALFVFGIGKAAVMPFHRWLPAAMVAPAPVSALLHAVAVVKAGVFSILKISVYIFGFDLLSELGSTVWLAYVAGFTIVVASLVAFTKDNLKARLAYSTISQLSYIVLGAMLANSWGVMGGGLHIVMHAFGKITLFFAAGAIAVAAHKTEISEMDGLGRHMPITMGAFLIGTLSIIGLPPAGGVWSKWLLGLGTVEADQLILTGVLMLSSLLGIGYLIIVPVRAFFMPERHEVGHHGHDHHAVDDHVGDHGHDHAEGHHGLHEIHEASMPMLIAMVITALVTVGLFFFPEPFYELMRMVVEQ